ncbi:hypothetical protein [Marinobacter segnicrescens]|uniref:hypothetical protein n=1 Tax=Marinobacter segnicrescens TaxID=430453 RepID=UPI000B874786|nr:hypothetical protein [Marinobacter segnicrescens]
MKALFGMIKGFGGKAVSTLLGPRVLIGIFLTLLTALVGMWWQLDHAKAVAANASLNNKNLSLVIEGNQKAIKQLQSERESLERLLEVRSAEKTSGDKQVAQLKKEIDDVKADQCLDTRVPDDFAAILRDN